MISNWLVREVADVMVSIACMKKVVDRLISSREVGLNFAGKGIKGPIRFLDGWKARLHELEFMSSDYFISVSLIEQ
jgi:hypothetical protein